MLFHDEHDDRRGLPRSLGPRLRREAREARPAFSPEFQARLLAGLEAGPRRPTPPAGLAAAAEPGVSAGWRPLVALAAGLAGVAAIAALAVMLPGVQPAAPGAGEGPAAALPAAQTALPATTEPAELPAIVLLPLYDEIEAGLRDGVRTLAESLVELPDWASLAEFDAAALLGAAIGPDAIGPE
jgi:hypothetical protein